MKPENALLLIKMLLKECFASPLERGRSNPAVSSRCSNLPLFGSADVRSTDNVIKCEGHNAASADIVTGTDNTATHTQQQQQQQKRKQASERQQCVTRIARTNIRLITWAIETHAAFPDAKIKMLGKNRKFEKISDELHHLTEFYRNPGHKFPKAMEFMSKFEDFDKFERYQTEVSNPKWLSLIRTIKSVGDQSVEDYDDDYDPAFGIVRRVSFERDGDHGGGGGGGGGGAAGYSALRRKSSGERRNSSDSSSGGVQGLLDDISRFQNEILKEQVPEDEADYIFVSAHQAKGLEW